MQTSKNFGYGQMLDTRVRPSLVRTNKFSASILWIMDSEFCLTNYILILWHWEFLIAFTKVLKLRKLSKFQILSIPRTIKLWFQANTKAWSLDARFDLVKKNSESSTTLSSWKFKKIIFWISTWAFDIKNCDHFSSETLCRGPQDF